MTRALDNESLLPLLNHPILRFNLNSPILESDKCRRLLKRSANDIIFSGISSYGSELRSFRADLPSFSSKIEDLDRAVELAASIDDLQYTLCIKASNMKDEDPLKEESIRMRLQLITGLAELGRVIDSIRTNRIDAVSREIIGWIKLMQRLNRQALSLSLTPARERSEERFRLDQMRERTTDYYVNLQRNATSTLAAIESILRFTDRNIPSKYLREDFMEIRNTSVHWLKEYAFSKSPIQQEDTQESVADLCNLIADYLERGMHLKDDEEFRKTLDSVRVFLNHLIAKSSVYLRTLSLKIGSYEAPPSGITKYSSDGKPSYG